MLWFWLIVSDPFLPESPSSYTAVLQSHLPMWTLLATSSFLMSAYLKLWEGKLHSFLNWDKISLLSRSQEPIRFILFPILNVFEHENTMTGSFFIVPEEFPLGVRSLMYCFSFFAFSPRKLPLTPDSALSTDVLPLWMCLQTFLWIVLSLLVILLSNTQAITWQFLSSHWNITFLLLET